MPFFLSTRSDPMDRSKDNTPAACSKSPAITYPCLWTYTVIGKEADATREAIVASCMPFPVKISPSHSSSKGSYWSLKAEIAVKDEPMRLSLYQSLTSHPAITLVL